MLKTLAFSLSTNYSLSIIFIISIFIILSSYIIISVYSYINALKKNMNYNSYEKGELHMCSCDNSLKPKLPCNNYMCISYIDMNDRLNCTTCESDRVTECGCYISPVKHVCKCSLKIDN
jgi:hypothetical protein